jgi:hypothetical protein
MLDVRYPIGYLFLALGLILTVYGYISPSVTNFITAGGSLPLNINIPWGILMFLFGMATTCLAKMDDIKNVAAQYTEQPAPETETGG